MFDNPKYDNAPEVAIRTGDYLEIATVDEVIVGQVVEFRPSEFVVKTLQGRNITYTTSTFHDQVESGEIELIFLTVSSDQIAAHTLMRYAINQTMQVFDHIFADADLLTAWWDYCFDEDDHVCIQRTKFWLNSTVVGLMRAQIDHALLVKLLKGTAHKP